MTTSLEYRLAIMTEAITRMAEVNLNRNTGGGGKEYTLHKVETFHGNDQDPMEWWTSFTKAALANNWSEERQLILAPTFFRKTADSWYKNLENEPESINAFKEIFLEQFRTPAKVMEWRSNLDLCRQKDNETVSQYTARFRDILEKLYPNEDVEAIYLHQYIRGFKPEILRLGTVASKTTIQEVLEAAKTAEVTLQYTAISEAINPTTNKAFLVQQENTQKLLQEIAELKKAFTTNTREKSQPEQRPWNNGFVCHKCGSPEHFIRNCPQSRWQQKPNKSAEINRWRNNQNNRRNTYRQLGQDQRQSYHIATEYTSETEEEPIYSNNLAKLTPIQMALDPNREYSIIKNLHDSPANITVGQLLQVSPYLREELTRGLRRVPKPPIDEETIDEEPIVQVSQTSTKGATPMRVKASVRGNTASLILDSESAVNLISKAFLEKIGEKSITASKMVISTANSKLVRPLGKVQIQVTVGILRIPMTAHILETTDYDLLAGNEWLREANASINWRNATVTLTYQGKIYNTTVDYGNTTPPKTIRFKPEYADETLTRNQVFLSWADEVEEAENSQQNSNWTTRSNRKNRPRRVPNICCVCGVRKSSMALKLSPHEEWGLHTVLYCSACHRETFEAWYREQEQFRTGKWTGTECLVCTQLLERTEWFDEPEQGGTCTLECHMVWQIYKKTLKGQNVLQAAQTISNKYEGYSFSEEENIRKTHLRIKKDKGFFWPCDEENWKWEMAPEWIREKGHPTEIRYYSQEWPDLNQEWLEGKPVIGPTIFDFEA